jgi:hypothetical protein
MSYLMEHLSKLQFWQAIAQASELSFPFIFHTENCTVHSESHGFLSLPADTMMASSQGTSISSLSFSRWASHDVFLFKYHFLLHILCSLFFFSDNIMADVASKQQMTVLFLSTVVTCTRRHTKLTNLMGDLCCAREHSVQFSYSFLHS